MESLDILALNEAMASDMPDEELQRKIDALKRSFTDALGKRLTEIDAALARFRPEVPLVQQPETVKSVLEQAHKIAGSAGTFGYGELSVIASGIEQLCELILKGGHGADEAARRELSTKIAALHAGAAL